MKWRSLEDTTARVEIRSLQEIYAERKELIARYVPEDVQAVHSCVVAELKESSIAEKSLQSGCKAPEFELSDHDGKLVRSSELLKSGPLIICFFRGRWCPFCVGQMEAMNVVYPEIRQLGASLVGISPQTTHQSYLMADQHKIQFSLLSDAGNRIARQFGLVYRVADYQTGNIQAWIHEPGIHQWRCQLGTSHSSDLHCGQRVFCTSRCCRCRLHSSARTA
jgi:peroxiredoxin